MTVVSAVVRMASSSEKSLLPKLHLPIVMKVTRMERTNTKATRKGIFFFMLLTSKKVNIQSLL